MAVASTRSKPTGGVRFAPSPTGHFHVGNLRTAWISHELARRLGLPWVLRFEDIDEPRNAPGAKESQLRDMTRLGLQADQTVIQSQNFERHREVFACAVEEGLVYPCFCSRKDVRDALDGLASAPHVAVPIYSGRCRSLKTYPATTLPSLAWRFRSDDDSGAQDVIVARTSIKLVGGKPDLGSFAPAYNWACAIDDFDGRYDLLVRAIDLGNVAEQQRAIHRMLGRWEGVHRAPAVFHTSLVVQNDGARLEKRTKGVTLDELAAQGVSPEDVAARFALSFMMPAIEELRDQIQKEGLIDEPRSQLTLSDLKIIPA